MSSGFKDHFSGHAGLYARHRPHYPRALFDWLGATAGQRRLAWDCGAGSGQAAAALAQVFARVIATDASPEQLGNAIPHPGVEYRVEAAEDSSLEPGSADLVFIGQALHWFDLDPFYAEVRRVLHPGGLVAALTYVQLTVNPDVDALVHWFHREVVGDCWPPERRHVDQAYASLPFPFARIEAPEFHLEREWGLADLLGYLSTWSAVQRYRSSRGADPIRHLEGPLEQAWGDPRGRHPVRWPLVVLAGRAG